MMPRRQMGSIAAVALVVALCIPERRPCFAGDPPTPPAGNAATAPSAPSDPAQAPAPAATAKKAGKSVGGSGLPGRRGFGAKLTGRESRQIRYLGEQIEAKTTLTTEEKTMVRQRLNNYADRMEAGMLEGSDVYDGPEESREDVEATFGPLPSSLVDPKAGLRPRGAKSKPPASPMGTHTYILKDIAASLNADARKQFDAVGLRWQRLKYRGGPDGPLSRLMRAIRDPLLQLTDEKTEALRNTVGSIMASVKTTRKDPEVMASVSKEARQKVDAELSPEQIKQLDLTLAEMAKEQDAEEANGKRLALLWKEEGRSQQPKPERPIPAEAPSKPAPEPSPSKP